LTGKVGGPFGVAREDASQWHGEATSQGKL
jgi:hypothetical protein